MENTQQKRYLIISGRRLGKVLLQKKMAELAISNGEWVARADTTGIYCYNCDKHIYRCGGKCLDTR